MVDLAEGHVKAVDHILGENRNGVHIFNLGTGTGATVLEVIKAFGEACGKEIPYEIAGRRKGDVDSLYASCDKAEKVKIVLMMMMMQKIVLSRNWGGKLPGVLLTCAGTCGTGRLRTPRGLLGTRMDLSDFV